MSNSHVREKFATIYESLPQSAKQALLEEHVFPMIDDLSLMSKIKLLGAAESAQSRYAQMPKLNLAAKTAEVDCLIDELKRDSYRGNNASRREEISDEVVDCLLSWLSDIWQVVYEFGVDFEEGHRCLLYSCKVLQQVAATGTGCKCSFMNMYVPLTIKDSCGTNIKHFSYNGAYLIEDAFLWIWRDMLLKMLESGKQCYLEQIPQMLQDIQSATRESATSLDRLLVAGGKVPRYQDEEDTDHEEEEDDDEDNIHRSTHAIHWASGLLDHLPALRRLISNALFEAFKLSPSLTLYTSIRALAPATMPSLHSHLCTAITYSGAAAAAALDIHSLNEDAKAIIHVFDVARPVLRPRDSTAMQHAVHVLSHTKHAAKALEIVSRELRDCVEMMRGVIVNSSFNGVNKEESKEQLAEVMKLRMNTAQRQEAVERWVDSVATAPSPAGNPLTFAAFLMGFPPGFEPEDSEEPDPFLFSGLKEGDPDYETLRDEWRPPLKERFEGWVNEASMLKAGGTLFLAKLARTIGEMMPYACGTDVVDEMIARIQDKPTKYHVCDALDALSVFMKVQKKKLLAEKNRKAARPQNTLWKGKKAAAAKLSKGLSARNIVASGSGSGSQTSASGSSAGPSSQMESTSLSDDDSMPGLEALD